MPRTPFNLLCGALYGAAAGLLIALVASVISAAIGYAMGYLGLTRAVGRLSSRYGALAALDRVARRQTMRLTVWWHLSLTLPFALINLWMGAARASWRRFILGKLVGIVPGTLLYTLLGAGLGAATLQGGQEAMEHPAHRAALWVGVAVSAALVIWLARLSKREMSIKESTRP